MGCHHSASKKKGGSSRSLNSDRQDAYATPTGGSPDGSVNRKKPDSLQLDDIRGEPKPPKPALKPASPNSEEWQWQTRPPAPAPDCSKKQLQEYLATYSILPVNFVPAEEPEEGPEDPGLMHAGSWSTSSPSASPKHLVAHAGGRRITVCDAGFDESMEANYKSKVVPKSQQETRTLMTALMKLAIFAHLDDKELETVVQAMDRANYPKDAVLYMEGDPAGDDDKLYIVIEGLVAISNSKGERAARGPGECVGEQDLLYIQPRHAVARVQSASLKAWTLTRLDYRHLLRTASMRKRQTYLAVLKKIPFLQPLTSAEMVQLADCLQPVKYQKGEYMIRYGDIGLWMYIILEGKVEVLGRREDGTSLVVCDFGEGDHVGELEFINKHLNVADVVASSEVRAARVHRDHFESCMGPIVDLLSKEARVNEKYEYYRSKNPSLRVTFKD